MSEGSLPSWLTEDGDYTPPHDRDTYLRKNVLRLTSVLTIFRAEGTSTSIVDRALSRVETPVRLLALLVVLTLIALSKNLAFCAVVLAAELALTAGRPARFIASIVGTSLVLSLLAALVNLPAAIFFGQLSSPVRVGVKTLATMLWVLSLARSTTPEELFSGLAGLGLPQTFAMTAELAIRDLALLGASAVSLTEALELRSVGKNTDKGAGVAGILSTCFMRAQRAGVAQAEAMELRGYGGTRTRRHPKLVTGPTVCYLLALLALIATFCYLEGTL